MDTEKRLGIKKSKAVMLFIQMILVIYLLIVSVYLLVFVSVNNLGGWMIASYIFISLSVLSIICYSIIGYKKGHIFYTLAIVPFIAAVFVNILLPNRNTLQIAFLAILFALSFAFLIKQHDFKFTSIISYLMVIVSLVFSIYSAITAKIDFLGELSKNWPTYVAMYTSIFVPVVMTVTFALTYNVRYNRKLKSK